MSFSPLGAGLQSLSVKQKENQQHSSHKDGNRDSDKWVGLAFLLSQLIML